MATSKSTLATILELERVIFHDRREVNFSEVDNLPISELYHLIVTGPTEHDDKDDGSEKQMSVSDMIANYRTLESPRRP